MGWYLDLFRTLDPPDASQVEGLHVGQLVGPLWMRVSAPIGLAIGGLPGWYGKEFFGERHGINVCKILGFEFKKLPLTSRFGTSMYDGRASLIVRYQGPKAGHWADVQDEFRRVDEHKWLGITIIDRPLVRKMAFPFEMVQRGA